MLHRDFSKIYPFTHAEHWTEGAVFCYKRGCNCNGCYVKDMLETRCEMKRAVFELVRKFGKPPENELKLTRTQQKIINSILAGCNNKTEISEYTGLNIRCVQEALSNMYELAEFDGLVYKNLRYKLPDFINWVRKGE